MTRSSIADHFPSRCPIEQTKRLHVSCRFHALRFDRLSAVVYARNQQVHMHNVVAISSWNVQVLQVMVPILHISLVFVRQHFVQ